MPVIRNESVIREKPIFWEWQFGQAVRDGKWKIVKQGLENDWSLFDLSDDPSETKNLAGANPEIVARMDAMFKAWKKRVSITK